jgi:hypothetical protein
MVPHLSQFGLLVLWICAVYHLVMGCLCMVSYPTIKRVVGKLYAARFPDPIDPGMEFLLKPLGALAVIISFFCWRGLLVDDVGYQAFLLKTLAALFLLRAGIRWFYRDLFARAHGTPMRRNLVNIIINTASAAATLIYGVR